MLPERTEEEIVEYIFNDCLKFARHPADGSLLSQELVLAAMKNAIRDAYHCGLGDQILSVLKKNLEAAK